MVKNRNYKTILIVICSIVVLALFVFMQILQSRNASEYNGVLQAIQFYLCLTIVMLDNKRGCRISDILLGICLVAMLRAVIFLGVTNPIPGIFNIIIYIITLNIIGSFLNKREKEAITDFLTGLENRRGLYNYLNAKVLGKEPFYVIYFDLDNFKMINDNQGHRYGDMILKEVAERMTTIVGKMGKVFRVSGDEFVVIVSEKNDPEIISEDVINEVNQKYNIIMDGRLTESYLTVYAGISKFPEDANNPDDLLKYSDIAMYQASKSKTNKVFFFDKYMADIIKRQSEVETMIKASLDNDYFYLAFQPQHEIGGKKLRGFETLLRMKLPDGTQISPGEFIPVAERSDLILRIDRYVLERALTEFKEVVIVDNSDLILSINISAKNAASKDFAFKLINLLEAVGFPAKNLEIEITEYCLLNSLEDTIENIRQLKDAGVKVALDDFGTGYTSLSYLAKLPINLLKLDKCLIDDVDTDEKSAEFIRSVVDLGHLMGCEVIAEGVEREEQLEVIKKHKCDYIQGFIWGRPMVLEDVKKVLREK